MRFFRGDKRQQVKDYLGVDIAEDNSAIEIKQAKLHPHLEPYSVYIRLKTSLENYEQLIQQLGLKAINDTPYWALLPGKWQPGTEVDFDWWQPTLSTPANAAGGDYGDSGWIIAKYEAPYAYFRLYNENQA